MGVQGCANCHGYTRVSAPFFRVIYNSPLAKRLIKQWAPKVFDAYGPLAAASMAKFGGRYLAKGDRIGLLEGDGPSPLAMAVLQFPNVEQAKA